jgi:glycosyltransferase involved in cell wall biosynthesis
MRIAVDAHAIGRHLTGNEVYVRSLLKGFAAAKDRECEFLAYVSSQEACGWLPAGIKTSSISANPFLRLGYELSMKLRQDQPDLLHVQYTAPMVCQVPVVVSVHDVSFLEHPEYFNRGRARQLRWTVRRTVDSAARVLTVSEFSRRAILRVYGHLDEDKVVVAHNAAGAEFRPISRLAAQAAIRQRFLFDRPFLLSVGDLQPRKNQIGLIRAFAELVRACPQLRHDLVLAGKPTWFADQVQAAARESGVADRIRLLGFVSDNELLQLYNACDVFVFPSFYEGFGLPALEAMACGRAVACSNASALPEVVDSAAILFDPYRIDEIVRALKDLLVDAELRARMERLGLQRAANFSWQKTANAILDVFREVAYQNRSAALAPSSSLAHR